MRLSELTNLGEITEQRLHAVGIRTVEDLELAGAVEAYIRVKECFPRETTLVLLRALQGALLDAHWNEISPTLKTELKAQLARRSE